MITTEAMGRLFRNAGRPIERASEPVTAEMLERYQIEAEKIGHWHGFFEENATIGIHTAL